MALTDFTSFDDIRAAIGVSDEEIDDATLSLSLYEIGLKVALEEINFDLITAFQARLEIEEIAWMPLDRRFVESTRYFSTYAVARHLTISLPLFSPKEISDGKAHITRYAVDPYKVTIEGVKGEFEQARLRLQAAYGAIVSTATPVRSIRTYFKAVAPLRDPITGT